MICSKNTQENEGTGELIATKNPEAGTAGTPGWLLTAASQLEKSRTKSIPSNFVIMKQRLTVSEKSAFLQVQMKSGMRIVELRFSTSQFQLY